MRGREHLRFRWLQCDRFLEPGLLRWSREREVDRQDTPPFSNDVHPARSDRPFFVRGLNSTLQIRSGRGDGFIISGIRPKILSCLSTTHCLLQIDVSRCKHPRPPYRSSKRPRVLPSDLPRPAIGAGKGGPSVLGSIHTHAKHVQTPAIPVSTLRLRSGSLFPRAILLSFSLKPEVPQMSEMTTTMAPRMRQRHPVRISSWGLRAPTIGFPTDLGNTVGH